MGGRLGVKSEVGVGSTFGWSYHDHAEHVGLIWWMIIRPAESADFNPRDDNRGSFKAVTNSWCSSPCGRDNATNQRVTRLILESGGHFATIVNNGDEALDALERVVLILRCLICQCQWSVGSRH